MMTILYPWFKVLHLLFVIAWMVGVFYLPRIFVHYAEGVKLGEDVRRLEKMIHKLFKFAGVVGVLAILTGLVLWLSYGVTGGWLHAKLLLVVFLVAHQLYCLRLMYNIKQGKIATSLFYRIFNELPLMLLVPILILAVLKPF